MSSARGYPFSLTEDEVTELIDLIENEWSLMGGVSDRMADFLLKLHGCRKAIMEERIAKLDYELEQLLTEEP